MRSQLRRQHCCTEVLEEAALRYQVFYVRNVVKDDRLRREQRRREAWQCGILGTADLDLPSKRIAAANQEFVHIATFTDFYGPTLRKCYVPENKMLSHAPRRAEQQF